MEVVGLVMMIIMYSFCNYDYWPLNLDIDYVLAIPHWYLRPLMGALVTIPHHYLGFLFIGMFFMVIILVPWIVESYGEDIWANMDSTTLYDAISTRWDLITMVVFSIFAFVACFSTSMVPTGKYFIDMGSMDSLVFVYWYLILYVLFFTKAGVGLYRLVFASTSV